MYSHSVLKWLLEVSPGHSRKHCLDHNTKLPTAKKISKHCRCLRFLWDFPYFTNFNTVLSLSFHSPFSWFWIFCSCDWAFWFKSVAGMFFSSAVASVRDKVAPIDYSIFAIIYVFKLFRPLLPSLLPKVLVRFLHDPFDALQKLVARHSDECELFAIQHFRQPWKMLANKTEKNGKFHSKYICLRAENVVKVRFVSVGWEKIILSSITIVYHERCALNWQR